MFYLVAWVLVLLEEGVLVHKDGLANSFEVILQFFSLTWSLKFFILEVLRLFQDAYDHTLNDLENFLVIDTPGLFESVPVVLGKCPQVLNGFNEELSVVHVGIFGTMEYEHNFLIVSEPQSKHHQVVNEDSTNAQLLN